MHSPSLFGRVVLALCLMIGFYVLAFAIALGLLALPVLELIYLHRLHLYLAISCLVGGAVILYSILPRADRFTPPGPLLTRDENSRLFELVEGVARDTGQAMPSEVYLTPDVNAWVAQRGGVMAFRSRRVMGLGLPLLQVLDIGQLRAVLAHEFGHYHGGDTQLGPWIHKTRTAIIRTIAELAAARRSMVQLPFLWYGKMFLRVTFAISRRQELAADALAARVAGPGALATGLKSIHGAAVAHSSYWVNEVVPILNSGFRPPLADGFRRFIHSSSIQAQVSSSVEAEIERGLADPYDSHPPLRERLAALGITTEEPRNFSAAIDLLGAVPEAEGRLLGVLASEDKIRTLKVIDWNDVGTTVYLPHWRTFASRYAQLLHGVIPEYLPGNAIMLDDIGKQMPNPDGSQGDPDERRNRAHTLLGCALTLALVERGWRVSALPGDGIILVREGEQVTPFELISALAAREIEAEDWESRCAKWGIAGDDLEALLRSTADA